MEINERNKTDKMIRAKKHVEELKGFYIHLLVYILVNIFITTVIVIALMGNGKSFGEALFNFGSFATAIFWGIGVFFHALKVYNYGPFFSKEWEKRQIRKYMEQDRQDAEKYR